MKNRLHTCNTDFHPLLENRALPVVVCWLSIMLMYPMSLKLEGQTIDIHGHYHWAEFNPKTGTPYVNQQGDLSFEAVISGMTWRICATNIHNSTIWSELMFDGTNTFTFNPYTSPFFVKGAEKSNNVFVTIARSPFYISATSDYAQISVPWMTYGLNPLLVVHDKFGLTPIPLPWETSRFKPGAYGWNWEITPSADGRFMAACRIARSSSLDLNQYDELLRPQIDYPESIPDRDARLRSLQYRQQITNGFVESTYICEQWLRTNTLTIPLKSEVTRYMYLYPKYPAFKASLTADSIQIKDKASKLIGPPEGNCIVHDYRYRISNKSRIFKYAEYTIESGQRWKGDNDKDLLQQANDYLKHGRKYNYYKFDIQLLRWVLGAVIIFPIVIMLIVAKRRKVRNTTKG